MNEELDRVKAYTRGRLQTAVEGIAGAKKISDEIGRPFPSLYSEGAADTARGILKFIEELEAEAKLEEVP